MADVLAEHFAVDSTAANQESVQLVMSQQLVMEALTTFADPCDQYHKTLVKHAELPKLRKRASSKSVNAKMQEVAALEASVKETFRMVARLIDVNPPSLAAQAHIRITLQQAASEIATGLSALPDKYKPITRSRKVLIRAHERGKEPEAALKPQAKSVTMCCQNTAALDWDSAFENVTHVIDAGRFKKAFKGPLKPQQLIHAMHLVRDSPGVVSLKELQIDGLGSQKIQSRVARQLAMAAPILLMKQRGTNVLIDVHAMLDQDAIMLEFIDLVFPSCALCPPVQGPPNAPAENESTVHQDAAAAAENESTVHQDAAAAAENESTVNQDAAAATENESRVDQDAAAATENESRVNQDAAAATENESRVNQDAAAAAENESTVDQDATTKKQKKRGKPAFYELFPTLADLALSHKQSKGWGAQGRRRDQNCDSVGVSCSDLRDHLMKHVLGLREFICEREAANNKPASEIAAAAMSVDAVEDLFLPANKQRTNAKRSHGIIPARVPPKRNQNSKEHEDCHFTRTQQAMAKEFAFDEEFRDFVARYSNDTCNKLRVGVLAVSRFHQIRRRFSWRR